MSVLTHVRIAGAMCAFVFLIGLVSALAGTRRARLSEIQLGTDPVKVQQLVADSAVRGAANRAIAIDYFFLVAYWAAFVALAALLGRRGGLWLVVAALAAIAATATATLDIIENVRTSEVLAVYQAGSQVGQRQLDALRHVSLFKWAASATTVTLLAGLFAQRDWIAVLAVRLLVVAGIGFAGIRWHGLIQGYLRGVGILTLTIAIPFLAFPNAETRRFEAALLVAPHVRLPWTRRSISSFLCSICGACDQGQRNLRGPVPWSPCEASGLQRVH